MINPNNFELLAETISEVINQPVSVDIIKNITPGQRALLTSLIYKHSTGQPYQQTIIESILNYGKNKIKKPEHSDKTNFYLANKLK